MFIPPLEISNQCIHPIISNDPYKLNFILPRYFLLVVRRDQIEPALTHEKIQFNQKDQQIAQSAF